MLTENTALEMIDDAISITKKEYQLALEKRALNICRELICHMRELVKIRKLIIEHQEKDGMELPPLPPENRSVSEAGCY